MSTLRLKVVPKVLTPLCLIRSTVLFNLSFIFFDNNLDVSEVSSPVSTEYSNSLALPTEWLFGNYSPLTKIDAHIGNENPSPYETNDVHKKIEESKVALKEKPQSRDITNR